MLVKFVLRNFVLKKISLTPRFLTPAPTSVGVERLFSDGGLVLDERRNRLDPERVVRTLHLETLILTGIDRENE